MQKEREVKMKSTKLLITLGLGMLLASAVAMAENAMAGTWKLNASKSTISAGAQRNDTVKIEMDGDKMKITVDGTDTAGKPVHTEWTGKDDGQEYPVTGDPNADMRSYKKSGDRSWAVTSKKGGKVTTSGTITVSADGKTRTVKVKGTNAEGKPVHTNAVYEKQ